MFDAALAGTSDVLYFEIEESGYGAMVSRIMTGLGIALRFNKRPVFCLADHGNRYSFPFTTIEQRHLSNVAPFWFQPIPGSFQWHFGPYFGSSIRNYFQYPTSPFDPALSKHAYCAQLMKYITRDPTDAFRAFFDQKRATILTGEGTCVGIHVRRGDKITESPNVPEQVYLHFMQQIPATVQRVFLTSDDPGTADRMRALLPPGIALLWDAEEARYNDDNKVHARESPAMALQESFTAMKNILLLGECDYVIGTHNAQFTWLGGLLCVANHGYDTSRHIMINPRTHRRGHWGDDYPTP